MFENIEKLEIVSALYGVSCCYKQFPDRPYHALVFKIDGECAFTFSSEKITLSEGQVLFIPKGVSYSVAQLSPGESHYALVNFLSPLPDARPYLYDCNGFDEFKYIVDQLMRVSLFNSLSGRFEMISLFYKIVSILHQYDRKNYCDSGKRSAIKPAADYIENNIFNSALRVGELHTMCNISDTYFRKIFISVYGVSPKKYVLNKRLIQAKNILDSGEYRHIYEVATAVGFDDPLYFSKIFKNKYGHLPSKSGGME